MDKRCASRLRKQIAQADCARSAQAVAQAVAQAPRMDGMVAWVRTLTDPDGRRANMHVHAHARALSAALVRELMGDTGARGERSWQTERVVSGKGARQGGEWQGGRAAEREGRAMVRDTTSCGSDRFAAG